MSYHLKSAGVDQVDRAIKAGGTLEAMGTSFYSGGYVWGLLVFSAISDGTKS